MLKKIKKIVSLLLAVVICFTLPLSVFAASATFGVDTSYGHIVITAQGWQGDTVTSNPVYFNVNIGDKTVKSITVQAGTPTRSGIIIGKTMYLEKVGTEYKGSTSAGSSTSLCPKKLTVNTFI